MRLPEGRERNRVEKKKLINENSGEKDKLGQAEKLELAKKTEKELIVKIEGILERVVP